MTNESDVKGDSDRTLQRDAWPQRLYEVQKDLIKYKDHGRLRIIARMNTCGGVSVVTCTCYLLFAFVVYLFSFCIGVIYYTF